MGEGRGGSPRGHMRTAYRGAGLWVSKVRVRSPGFRVRESDWSGGVAAGLIGSGALCAVRPGLLSFVGWWWGGNGREWVRFADGCALLLGDF